MNYQPLVTILIPIKNVARYIGPCLDALLNQTYQADKFEIWLLDNHSNDGTLDIVEQYPRNRVKIIQTGIDSPPIKYNKIIPQINTEIIGFVDGDANVSSNWLEKVIAPLKDSKVAGASGVILTQNKNKLVPRIIGYELQDRYERMPKEIKRVATMHVVYKKEVLEKIGGFNESVKTGYDSEIGYRINDAGYKIINIPEATVYHNHRETLWTFFKQQYEYGKFGLVRFLQMLKIAKGDDVTSFWMISQSFFYLASIVLLIIWLFYKFPWYFILSPLLILYLSYIFSSFRLALKYKDASAIFAFIIYLIRVWGWALGAFITAIKLFKNIFKKNKHVRNSRLCF
jgi:cellulose synthase/poly-beta-1,6-N-acetylglucosamine synthase-like glycosyltransferase